MGVASIIDSLQLFVETQNFSYQGSNALLTVTASATGTYTSLIVSNAGNKGGTLFVNLATVNATCTIALNLQARDPVSSNYQTIARVSLDAVQATVATSALWTWQIYPGITASVSTLGVGTNDFATSKSLPRNTRIVASITATASGGSAATSITIGMDKQV